MTATFERLLNRHAYPGFPYVHMSIDEIKHLIATNGRKISFAHVQKTGGTSVRIASNQMNVISEGHGWVGTREKYSGREGRLIYSHVRNPFDWFVSFWCHGSKGVGDVQYTYRGEFKEFIMDIHKPSDNRHPGDVVCRSGYFHRGHHEKTRWPLRILQPWQTFECWESPGLKKSVADFYIRFERMNEAYQELFDIELTHENRSMRPHYSEYWDEEMVQHVSYHRARELELLGYNFDGPVDDAIAIKIIGGYHLEY